MQSACSKYTTIVRDCEGSVKIPDITTSAWDRSGSNVPQDEFYGPIKVTILPAGPLPTVCLNGTHMLTLSTLVILNTISETPPTGIRSLPVVNSRTCFCRSDDISVTTFQKFLAHNRRRQHVSSRALSVAWDLGSNYKSNKSVQACLLLTSSASTIATTRGKNCTFLFWQYLYQTFLYSDNFWHTYSSISFLSNAYFTCLESTADWLQYEYECCFLTV